MLLFIDFSLKMMHSLWTNIFAVFLKYRLQYTSFRYCCLRASKEPKVILRVSGPAQPFTAPIIYIYIYTHTKKKCTISSHTREKTLIISVSHTYVPVLM